MLSKGESYRTKSSKELGIAKKKGRGGVLTHAKIFLVDLTQCTECTPE